MRSHAQAIFLIALTNLILQSRRFTIAHTFFSLLFFQNPASTRFARRTTTARRMAPPASPPAPVPGASPGRCGRSRCADRTASPTSPPATCDRPPAPRDRTLPSSMRGRAVSIELRRSSFCALLNVLVFLQSSLPFPDRCKSVSCLFGGRCEEGECVCGSVADRCPESYEPVCASNGKIVSPTCPYPLLYNLPMLSSAPVLQLLLPGAGELPSAEVRRISRFGGGRIGRLRAQVSPPGPDVLILRGGSVRDALLVSRGRGRTRLRPVHAGILGLHQLRLQR